MRPDTQGYQEFVVKHFIGVITARVPQDLEAEKTRLAEIWRRDIPDVELLLNETLRHTRAELRAAQGKHRWEVGERLVVVANTKVFHYYGLGAIVTVEEVGSNRHLQPLNHYKVRFVSGERSSCADETQWITESDLKLAPPGA